MHLKIKVKKEMQNFGINVVANYILVYSATNDERYLKLGKNKFGSDVRKKLDETAKIKLKQKIL